MNSHPIHQFLAKIFQQPKKAWAVVLFLSCFDLTVWLAIVILCLLVLRLGLQKNFNLVCASFVLHGLSLYWHQPSAHAWINAFNDYWPAFIAAVALMYSRSWYWTFLSMLLFVLCDNVVLELLFPEYPSELLALIVTSLEQYSSQLHLPLHFLSKMIASHHSLAVSTMMGMDNMAVVFNAFISLSMARSLQSQLFNPQGFLHEMLNLRASTWLFFGLLLTFLMTLGSISELPLYALPSLLLYVAGVGLSIAVGLLAKNKIQLVFIVLSLATMVLPYIFLPCFIVMGLVDCLIDLRTLLANRFKYTF